MTLISLLRTGKPYWYVSKPFTEMARILSADPFPIRTTPHYGPRVTRIFCKICLDQNIRIKHRHHSTMFARRAFLEADQPYIDCISCKVRHTRDIKGDRYKVLVTSSTLHDAWLEPSVRNLFHIDLISICGGSMSQGRRAFMADYGLQPKALDVVVAMGLNDVRKIKPEAFKAELDAFVGNIEGHEAGYNVENTIGFVKLPHMPCMAWLPGDGPPPHPNYRNYLSKVDTFNEIIMGVNQRSGRCQNMVSFENEGERRTRLHLSQHVWNSFREEKQEDMMHLKDYHHAKMYNRVVKYFQKNTIMCQEDYNV